MEEQTYSLCFHFCSDEEHRAHFMHAAYIIHTVRRRFISFPRGFFFFPNALIKQDRELKCHHLLATVVTLLQSPVCALEEHQ